MKGPKGSWDLRGEVWLFLFVVRVSYRHFGGGLAGAVSLNLLWLALSSGGVLRSSFPFLQDRMNISWTTASDGLFFLSRIGECCYLRPLSFQAFDFVVLCSGYGIRGVMIFASICRDKQDGRSL